MSPGTSSATQRPRRTTVVCRHAATATRTWEEATLESTLIRRIRLLVATALEPIVGRLVLVVVARCAVVVVLRWRPTHGADGSTNAPVKQPVRAYDEYQHQQHVQRASVVRVDTKRPVQPSTGAGHTHTHTHTQREVRAAVRAIIDRHPPHALPQPPCLCQQRSTVRSCCSVATITATVTATVTATGTSTGTSSSRSGRWRCRPAHTVAQVPEARSVRQGGVRRSIISHVESSHARTSSTMAIELHLAERSALHIRSHKQRAHSEAHVPASTPT